MALSSVSGTFFDGQNTKKEEVLLKALDVAHWCVMRADGSILVKAEPMADANVSSRLGAMPRFVRFAGGGVFETADNDGIDAMLAPHRDRLHGLPHRLESSLRYALLGLIVTAAFVFGVVRYGIPAAAEEIAFALPPETTRLIGQGTLDLLDRTFFDASEIDANEQERLRQGMRAFIDSVDGIPLQIEFRDGGGIGANALALPSGMIVFTDQLVRLAENDEELLSIYAHEVGHVQRRHAMRRMLQASALTVGVALVTGDLSSTSSIISAAPAVLVEMGYSRDFEREADRFALQSMQDKNIPTGHFTAVMRRLEASHKKDADDKEDDDGDESGVFGYLSTHPATEERVKAFGEVP